MRRPIPHSRWHSPINGHVGRLAEHDSSGVSAAITAPTSAAPPSAGLVATGGRSARRYGAWITSGTRIRSEEHTSELQSLMRNSYAVFCLKKKHTNLTTLTTY